MRFGECMWLVTRGYEESSIKCAATSNGLPHPPHTRTRTRTLSPRPPPSSSLRYLAPEIIQSKGHGLSVDWWAMGVLIFEMLAGYPPFYDENPFGIYQKILGGKIDFPRHFDNKAKDLIKKLLTHDRTKRIGCLKNGAEDIKNHKWFAKLSWDAVLNKEIPAPFRPQVSSADDTHNFDPYPDSVEDTAQLLSGDDKALFDYFDTV